VRNRYTSWGERCPVALLECTHCVASQVVKTLASGKKENEFVACCTSPQVGIILLTACMVNHIS
jgi:hypothetical protein